MILMHIFIDLNMYYINNYHERVNCCKPTCVYRVISQQKSNN